MPAGRANGLRAGFETLADKYGIIGDIRGKGLLQGIEFVQDPKTKKPFPPEVGFGVRVGRRALANGLLCRFDPQLDRLRARVDRHQRADRRDAGDARSKLGRGVGRIATAGEFPMIGSTRRVALVASKCTQELPTDPPNWHLVVSGICPLHDWLGRYTQSGVNQIRSSLCRLLQFTLISKKAKAVRPV